LAGGGEGEREKLSTFYLTKPSLIIRNLPAHGLPWDIMNQDDKQRVQTRLIDIPHTGDSIRY
jgi:hypothetical protein